jgi:hypothetical protein
MICVESGSRRGAPRLTGMDSIDSIDSTRLWRPIRIESIESIESIRLRRRWIRCLPAPTIGAVGIVSIRGMRRHSASGRPRRHVSFFDIGYEPTTLPTRPSNPLPSRQGRFGGRKSVPAARADRPLSGQLAGLCQTAGADGDAPFPDVRRLQPRRRACRRHVQLAKPVVPISTLHSRSVAALSSDR